MNTTPTEGGDPPEEPDGLAQFVADARVDDAVRDRRRQHHLSARAAEGSDTVGALLAALDRSVTVHLTGATSPVTGSVFSVGDDVVELRTPTTTWWIALRAVGAVETDGALLGDPADRADTTLAELLGDLVDSATAVTAVLLGGMSLHGEVVAVGAALVLQLRDPERHAVIELEQLVAITRRTTRR